MFLSLVEDLKEVSEITSAIGNDGIMCDVGLYHKIVMIVTKKVSSFQTLHLVYQTGMSV